MTGHESAELRDLLIKLTQDVARKGAGPGRFDTNPDGDTPHIDARLSRTLELLEEWRHGEGAAAGGA